MFLARHLFFSCIIELFFFPVKSSVGALKKPNVAVPETLRLRLLLLSLLMNATVINVINHCPKDLGTPRDYFIFMFST